MVGLYLTELDCSEIFCVNFLALKLTRKQNGSSIDTRWSHRPAEGQHLWAGCAGEGDLPGYERWRAEEEEGVLGGHGARGRGALTVDMLQNWQATAVSAVRVTSPLQSLQILALPSLFPTLSSLSQVLNIKAMQGPQERHRFIISDGEFWAQATVAPVYSPVSAGRAQTATLRERGSAREKRAKLGRAHSPFAPLRAVATCSSSMPLPFPPSCADGCQRRDCPVLPHQV